LSSGLTKVALFTGILSRFEETRPCFDRLRLGLGLWDCGLGLEDYGLDLSVSGLDAICLLNSALSDAVSCDHDLWSVSCATSYTADPTNGDNAPNTRHRPIE